jgi:CysZ protein
MENPSDSGTVERIVGLPGGAIAGLIYPFRALVFLLQTPKLWSYVVVPVLVNLVIGVALYVGLLLPGWQFIDQWSSGLPNLVTQWVTTLPNWLNRVLFWLPSGAAFIDDVLRWLLAIVLFITIGLLLVQFGAIFGAPWYGGLSEQIEKKRMGTLPTAEFSLRRALKDIGRAIAFQLKKLGLMVGGAIVFLLLGFLPVGGAIASVGWIILSSVLVCMDFLDPPLERRRLNFRRKLGILGRAFPASGTFGWVCLVLVSVPLLNLLAVPLCIIAGTLFCCDRVIPYLPAADQDSYES